MHYKGLVEFCAQTLELAHGGEEEGSDPSALVRVPLAGLYGEDGQTLLPLVQNGLVLEYDRLVH